MQQLSALNCRCYCHRRRYYLCSAIVIDVLVATSGLGGMALAFVHGLTAKSTASSSVTSAVGSALNS